MGNSNEMTIIFDSRPENEGLELNANAVAGALHLM